MKNLLFLFFFLSSVIAYGQSSDSTANNVPLDPEPIPIHLEVVLTSVKLVNVNIMQLGNFNMLECKTRYWGKSTTLLLPVDAPVYNGNIVTLVEGFSVPRHILVNDTRYYDYQHKRIN